MLDKDKKEKELEKHPKYELITIHFAEYIVSVQNQEIKNSFLVKRFKNRTISNIKNKENVNIY